jgi:hypothetical protein
MFSEYFRTRLASAFQEITRRTDEKQPWILKKNRIFGRFSLILLRQTKYLYQPGFEKTWHIKKYTVVLYGNIWSKLIQIVVSRIEMFQAGNSRFCMTEY